MLQRFPSLWQILFFSAYSRVQVSDPVEKKTQTKQSEFSLIRGDKVLMLSFMSFHMDLVMMSDKKGMLMSDNVIFYVSEHRSNNNTWSKGKVMSCFVRS